MYIGIDLGGTKIEIIALDESGGELARLRVPTPRGDYRATLAAIAGLVRKVDRTWVRPVPSASAHPAPYPPGRAPSRIRTLSAS